MASEPFNTALGRLNELAERVNNNDPTNAVLVICLFTGTETDNNLRDADSLAAVIALALNECAATNYVRKVLTDADVGATVVDDTGDTRSFDIADPVWTSLGGAVNETLTRLGVFYDSDSTAGTDTNIEGCAFYDFAIATNGGNITAQVNASGLWSSTRA